MPNFHFERDAIERALSRLATETPAWRSERVHVRLATQGGDYQPAARRIRFVGVSRPKLPPFTERNRVGVFVPWTEGDPIDPVPANHDWLDAVIVRDPTAAERAASGLSQSALRVVEAIDVIARGPGDVFRPLGVQEFFVAV